MKMNFPLPKIADLQMSFKIHNYDSLEKDCNDFDYIFSDL
jgi:hypothetical protein